MRIDLWGWQREATRGDHREFLSLFEKADALGFGGAWFNEYHFQDPPQPYPSILLLAAALFARTERLRVGTAILVLPLHQPHLLAEEIAQLDFQSGGRIDIGLGRGTVPETFEKLGIDPASTRERFDSGYDALIETWGKLDSVQRPHPPLYIAGSTRETLAFAARRGLPLLLSLDPSERHQLALCEEIEREERLASNLRQSSLGRYVVVAPTRAKAEAAADDLLAKLHERRRAMAAQRGLPLAPLDRDWALANQFIWGAPEQCIEQIHDCGRRLGVDKMRCVFNGNGVLGNDAAIEGMTLFAREVLPAVA